MRNLPNALLVAVRHLPNALMIAVIWFFAELFRSPVDAWNVTVAESTAFACFFLGIWSQKMETRSK